MEFSTSEKPSDQNDEMESSTIAQAIKSTISPQTPTPSSLPQSTTSIITTEIVDEYEEEGNTANAFAKTETPIARNNVHETINDSQSNTDADIEDETTNKNANTEHVSASDVTTMTTETITESHAKSEVVSSSTMASITKSNDRSRIVSKDDIESIRGRALNLSSVEHRQPASGVIYVTAPPTPSMPKMSKTFIDDLSDVSMDNDGMEVHSSEHIATTPSSKSMHQPECTSKVSKININAVDFIAFLFSFINLIRLKIHDRFLFVINYFTGKL